MNHRGGAIAGQHSYPFVPGADEVAFGFGCSDRLTGRLRTRLTVTVPFDS
jgi:hypothetical protein